MELTSQQQECFQKIKDFLNNPKKRVFILKGYAGTGKTFLLNIISKYLTENKIPFHLMAPTGRAAKVLRSKVEGQEALTIHRTIYSFSYVRVNEEDGNVKFFFPLNLKKDQSICIVDEASMISSRKALNELYCFGTSVLLDDLLNFANVGTDGKIIFVGDPMQLPPVGDNESNALNETYFKELGVGYDSYQLTDIVRQKTDSAILENAMKIRNLIDKKEKNELVLSKKVDEVMDIDMKDIPQYFCNQKDESAAVVCFSNAQANEYNVAIRKIIFPDAKHVEVGDKLMVVNNSYSDTYDLLNGDIITVTEVSEEVLSQSAPVWKIINGNKERVTITLTFREIGFQTEDGETHFRFIHESLLESTSANLSPDEIKALYINTLMRLRGANTNLNTKSEDFSTLILNDEFYSALQVKYGYAFTCHKSQGGEWNSAFIDFHKRTGLDVDCLRWKYTAITRAKEKLFCANLPDITPLSSLKINAIQRTSKMASEALSIPSDIQETPYHKSGVPVGVKMKYWSIAQHMDESDYSILNVTCGSYRDTYEIESPSGTVRVDCLYNGAGVFTRYETKSDDSALLDLLKDESNMRFSIAYNPSLDSLKTLYNRIVSLCDELDIVITNVVEGIYKVTYYLKTTGKYASLNFTYNGKGAITYVSPLSDVGEDDVKLGLLIEKLK